MTTRLYRALGVFSILLVAVMLLSGVLMRFMMLRPLVHERLGMIGMPIVLVYLVWSVGRGP